MTTCSNCQTKNLPEAKFCKNCGHKLIYNSPVSPPSEPSDQNISQPLQNQRSQNRPLDENTQTPNPQASGTQETLTTSFQQTAQISKKKNWWKALIVLVLFGPLGLLLIWFIWDKTSFSRNIKIIATIVVLLLSVVINSIFINFIKKDSSKKPFSQTKTSSFNFPTTAPNKTNIFHSEKSQPKTNSTFAKYFIDSDSDAIADFIEQEMGTDPNKNECVAKSGCGDQDIDPLKSQQKNILFILDSSGSMALQVGGEQKMASAKRALKEHIAKIDPNINVGLMVYGHKGSNSKADKTISCAGIEMIYPLGKIDKNTFNTVVDSFSATGWTPIADSLIKAKNEVFAGKENDSNFIVLLSDGVETCNGNPVSIAQQIEEAKTATIDVIGFGVDTSAKSQLRQIASDGGGRYYGAENFSQLFNALGETMRDTLKLVNRQRCRDINFVTYQTCLSLTETRYIHWSNQKFFKLYSNEATKKEAFFLRDEYNPIVKNYYNSMLKANSQNYKEIEAKFKENWNKINSKYSQSIKQY